ncbi:hypothetical protein GQ55_8G014700 [Panicum hallii var. hallii]|uniref:Uncharacterized protein n=1 Tax=Panicum hallii var. hallii TaxID=1504633 RepID=A0A2T7CJI7_9POAL|nr:hypothetical protein GQ55_8G014700 [Panicum hallii var. hallii]
MEPSAPCYAYTRQGWSGERLECAAGRRNTHSLSTLNGPLHGPKTLLLQFCFGRVFLSDLSSSLTENKCGASLRAGKHRNCSLRKKRKAPEMRGN